MITDVVNEGTKDEILERLLREIEAVARPGTFRLNSRGHLREAVAHRPRCPVCWTVDVQQEVPTGFYVDAWGAVFGNTGATSMTFWDSPASHALSRVVKAADNIPWVDDYQSFTTFAKARARLLAAFGVTEAT